MLTKNGLCVDYNALPSKPLGQYGQKLCGRKAHSILSDTYSLFIIFLSERNFNINAIINLCSACFSRCITLANNFSLFECCLNFYN